MRNTHPGLARLVICLTLCFAGASFPQLAAAQECPPRPKSARGVTSGEARPDNTPGRRIARIVGGPYDSGGPLIYEEAAYDVTFYDLTVAVNPADSTIAGSLEMDARVVAPAARIAFDLDTILAIHSVRLVSAHEGAGALRFRRCEGRIFVSLPRTWQPGESLAIRVDYEGRPRVAPNPPWDGGFTWKTTASGAPWIATSNQTIGADVWWPNKDHVSDKPDSVALHVTVPDPLVVASNGRLRGMHENGDGTRTYHWFVSTPISNYNVALNIAPYRTIEARMASVAGDTFPVVFYVLPESYEQGRRLFPQILAYLHWFEKTLGPYPFRADKYGAVQTPYLGMEHQSITAYGANFDSGAMTGGEDWGFDALLHHESSHEWWGNLLTNADWKDMWLHEGFATYMQALYLEDTQGIGVYHKYLHSFLRRIQNRWPVAPRESRSSRQIYGGDIYFKGAWTLHTLRYLIGERALRRALRTMVYPDSAHWHATDGSQTRFVSTQDFLTIAEEASGRKLGWFFDVYLRQAALPRLRSELRASPSGRSTLKLRWEAPDGLPFPMPVDVQIGDRTVRADLSGGEAEIPVPAGVRPVIDPDEWVLRAALLRS